MVKANDPVEADSDREGPRVRVIERAFDILEILAERGPRTLSEIASLTGLSKATTFRLLSELSQHGAVVKDPETARHLLGPGILRLVSGAVSGLSSTTSIAGLSRSDLEDLARLTGETVAVHVQVGLTRVCVSEVPSPQAIRFTSTVGSSALLTVGSAGKALLAFAEPEEQDKLIPLLVDGHDEQRLRALLSEVKSAGFATSRGEKVPGVAAVSVPVHTPHMLLALSVLGPEGRLPDAALRACVPPLLETAERVRATAERMRATGSTPISPETR